MANRSAVRMGMAAVVTCGLFLGSHDLTRLAFRGGTPAQRAVVGWAVERYVRAGMPLPSLDVRFHDDPAGCGGNSGFYANGLLDVCVPGDSPYARNVVVHELAHAWCEAHLAPQAIDRFLRLRGLRAWNDPDDPWGVRGTEQAAEVITWAVGDRAIEPLIPGDALGPRALRAAFVTLTGRPVGG
jgi:hypothetical protein